MNKTILVIEDNEQNLYMVTYLFEKKGYSVVAARTGPEGIALARSVQPAVILLDIQLPLMDGYSVARELRKISSLATTPIIAVTSYAMVGDRDRILKAGCTDYIEKPIDPENFVGQIEAYL